MHSFRHGLDFSPQASPQDDGDVDFDIDHLTKLIQDHVMAHNRIPRSREIERMLALCAIHKEE